MANDRVRRPSTRRRTHEFDIRLFAIREVKATYKLAIRPRATSSRKNNAAFLTDRIIRAISSDMSPSPLSGRQHNMTDAISWVSRVLLGGDPIVKCPVSMENIPKRLAAEADGHRIHPRFREVIFCNYCNDRKSLDSIRIVIVDRLEEGHGNLVFCNSCLPRTGWEQDSDGAWFQRNRTTGSTDVLLPYSTNPITKLGNPFRMADGERAWKPANLRTRLVRGAQQRMLPVYHLKTGEPLWLGVELEVEARNRVDHAIRFTKQKVGDFAICKADGSLGPDGFEICSVPGTIAWHQQVWQPFLAEAPKYLRGWNAGEESGIHIHVGRESLGTLAAGRLMTFIHSPMNRTFIEHIAGRTTEFAEFYSNTQVKTALSGRARGHYDAAGPSGHKPTIEIRIFRSNVTRNGFLRTLEFTHALATWCQVAGGISVGALDWSSFLGWFSDPPIRKAYPEFDLWVRRNYEVFKPTDGKKIEETLGEPVEA